MLPVQNELLKKMVLAEWPTINSLAARRFKSPVLAEEAALAVMDVLAANDWSRLKSYQGKSSFRTYLKILVGRLLEDFARKKFGRLRPPAWLSKLGGIWLQLFLALCQQRLGVGEALETLAGNYRKPALYDENPEDVCYEILARIPDCGKHQYKECEFSETDPEVGETDQEATTSQTAEVRQQKDVLEAIFGAVMGREVGLSGTLSAKMNELKLELGSEEKLLLKLCYQDGFDVTGAGRILGLNRFQAHGRMKRLLARLQAEFDRVGLSGELITLLRD